MPKSGAVLSRTGSRKRRHGAVVSVDKPEQFPLVAADRIEAPDELNVTGSVFPDISREIPVISLASGRVVDINARLGDNVKKGQLLFKVQSPDITNAFDAYLKAVNDEQLANKAYVRAKDLFAHGAISQSMLEQAEDAENDAKADLSAAEQQLNTLGVDKGPPIQHRECLRADLRRDHRAERDQCCCGRRDLLRLADGFHHRRSVGVWIICDVYENDLPRVHLGQEAQIGLNAYPDKVLTGRVSDIGPVLDPTIRTAKVRIEVPNPGMLQTGHVCDGDASQPARCRPTPLYQLPRSCTCMIAIGSLCLPATRQVPARGSKRRQHDAR